MLYICLCLFCNLLQSVKFKKKTVNFIINYLKFILVDSVKTDLHNLILYNIYKQIILNVAYSWLNA